jgi:hypothetical protein
MGKKKDASDSDDDFQDMEAKTSGKQTRSIADVKRPSKRALSSRVVSKPAKTNTAAESADEEKAELFQQGYLHFDADWAAKAAPRTGQQIAMRFEDRIW